MSNDARRMKSHERNRTLDILILAPSGPAGDIARRLYDQLAQRGLRVKLDIVSEQAAPLFRLIGMDDAKQSRFCVVLRCVGEATHFALTSARRISSQVPTSASIGTTSGPEEVETGVLSDDIDTLAARIEERVKA